MKIGVDLRCLMGGRSSGVEEFALQLVNNLLKSDKKNEYILFFNSFGPIAFALSRLESGPNVKIIRTKWPNKLLNLLLWYFGWPNVDRLMGNPDLVYFPNLNFGRVSDKCFTVQTVHDMSFEHYPETFSLKGQLWHFFVGPRRICRQADLIVAVSQSTRDDLTERYRLDGQKISVIYSAIGPGYGIIDRNDLRMVEVSKKYGLPYKFIFFLGTIEHRKNLASLIRAYAQLKKSNNPELQKCKLVLAGNFGYGADAVRREISESGLADDILMIGPVAEEDKPHLYNLAVLFVYPSLYEGFGFPVLESMACGTPVITSNLSSLPEVAGDAAMLIDPEKPDELFQAMRMILIDKDLRARLSQSGLRNVQRFSWKKTAQSYLKVFESLDK